MSDQTVFSNETPNNPQGEVTQPSPVNPDNLFKDQLTAITNERGEQKYDSVPKALDALKHSQDFISQLQQEAASKDAELTKLREEAAKAQAVEDVVSRLTTAQDVTATTVQGLDEEGATALFQQLTAQQTAQQAEANNFKAVNTALIEKFGSPEAANKIVLEKAAELGTSPAELERLSKTQPKMVLALFGGITQKPVTNSPAQPSVNSDGFLGKKVEEGLAKPEKSLLSGATYKEQLAYLKQIREKVYNDYGITP